LNPFRFIISTLLALLIASPLCCCSSKTSASAGRGSCCAVEADQEGKGSEEKTPHSCACKSKEPKSEAKTLEIPSDMALLLEPVVQDLTYANLKLAVKSVIYGAPRTDCDPPKWLLVSYSRWLI
jgi:hypothetical protein